MILKIKTSSRDLFTVIFFSAKPGLKSAELDHKIRTIHIKSTRVKSVNKHHKTSSNVNKFNSSSTV
jgi:hypothetical protein